MSEIVRCVCGPRLYRIHRTETLERTNYIPNGLESTADSVVKWIRFFKAFSYWTSPVLLTYLYRKNFFTIEGAIWMSKFVGSIMAFYYTAIVLRGVGRWMNPDYVLFTSVLSEATNNYTADTRRKLAGYDSEFGPWPIDFRWTEVFVRGKKVKKSVPWTRKSRGIVDKIRTLPCHILSYIAVHTFGRRMVYPGATSMQVLLSPVLVQGRAKLVEEKNGQRSKLLAEDGNEIESMFVDRRNDPNFSNGNKLVICSEGNAGFYEIGWMVTPLEAQYSVLGWNHPGFGGSTGVPFPDQEQCAIDVVMQYAIHRLGFKPEDIILFAWSIGGYPATWAAMNYPDVRSVILDATFDHLEPLAINRMPQSWRPLVVLTIKKYLNLNNAEQLCRYPGPVLLIRRTKDEMITTQEPIVLSSNRGNFVLIQLLQNRYPKLVDEETIPILREWLSRQRNAQLELWIEHGVEEDLCNSIMRSYVLENSNSFPSFLGEDLDTRTKIQMTLFLAHVHMTDFEAAHGVLLPAHLFREPWEPQLDIDTD